MYVPVRTSTTTIYILKYSTYVYTYDYEYLGGQRSMLRWESARPPSGDGYDTQYEQQERALGDSTR